MANGKKASISFEAELIDNLTPSQKKMVAAFVAANKQLIDSVLGVEKARKKAADSTKLSAAEERKFNELLKKEAKEADKTAKAVERKAKADEKAATALKKKNASAQDALRISEGLVNRKQTALQNAERLAARQSAYGRSVLQFTDAEHARTAGPAYAWAASETPKSSITTKAREAQIRYEEMASKRIVKAKEWEANTIQSIEKMKNDGLISKGLATAKKLDATLRSSNVIKTVEAQSKFRIDKANATANAELAAVKRGLKLQADARKEADKKNRALMVAQNAAVSKRAEQRAHFGSFMSMAMGGSGYMAFNLMKMGAGLAAVAASFMAMKKAIGATVGELVTMSKVAKEFDSKMAALKSVTKGTKEDMRQLETTAKMLGRTTVFTAREIADAFYALAKLGYDPKQIMQGGGAIVNLAAATGESLESSGAIAAKVMKQFEMGAQEMSYIVDTMTYSFNKSALDLNKFANTMEYAGPIANATGVTLDQVTAAMMVMADRGIDAEKAGTSLRSMMIELGDGSSKAMKLLKKLGITVEDDFGKKLRALKSLGLGPGGLKTLFTKWAATGATALLAGLDTFDTQLAEMETKAEGTAERMAKTRLDTFDGDITYMLSALESFRVEVGQQLDKALRMWPQTFKAAFERAAEYVREHKNSLLRFFTDISRFAYDTARKLEPLAGVIGYLMEKITGVGSFGSITDNIAPELPSISSVEEYDRWAAAMGKLEAEAASMSSSVTKDQAAAMKSVKDTFGIYADAYPEAFKAAKSMEELIANIQQAMNKSGATSYEDLKAVEEFFKGIEKGTTNISLTIPGKLLNLYNQVKNSAGLYKLNELFEENSKADAISNFFERKGTAWEESRRQIMQLAEAEWPTLYKRENELEAQIKALEVVNTLTDEQSQSLARLRMEYSKTAKQQAFYRAMSDKTRFDFTLPEIALDEVIISGEKRGILDKDGKGGGEKFNRGPRVFSYYKTLAENLKRDNEALPAVLQQLGEKSDYVSQLMKTYEPAKKQEAVFIASYTKEADKFKTDLMSAFERANMKDLVQEISAMTDDEASIFRDITKTSELEKYVQKAVEANTMSFASFQSFVEFRADAISENIKNIRLKNKIQEAEVRNLRKEWKDQFQESKSAQNLANNQKLYIGSFFAVDEEAGLQKAKLAERKKDELNLVYAMAAAYKVSREDTLMAISELNARYALEEELIDREALSAKFEKLQGYVGAVNTMYGTLNDTQAILHDMEMARIEEKYNKEAENIAYLREARLVSGRTADIMEKSNAKRREAEMKKAQDSQKKWAIAAAVFNYGDAVLGTWAGWAKYGPVGVGAAIAQTAMLSGLLTAQIAQINAQKYQTGGFPQGRNAIVQVNENGQEAILNASATARLGRSNIDRLNAGRPMMVNREQSVSQTFVYSPAHSFETSSKQVDIVEALRKDREGFAEFVNDSRRRGYKV